MVPANWVSVAPGENDCVFYTLITHSLWWVNSQMVARRKESVSAFVVIDEIIEVFGKAEMIHQGRNCWRCAKPYDPSA
jgi:hypothetical protein